MKKAILSLAVMLGLAFTINAQEIQVPKWFDPISQEARKMVNTTPEQEKQVRVDWKEFRKKVAAIRKNNTLNQTEKNKEIKKLKVWRSNRFFGEILTPEQSAKLRAIQKEKNAERRKAIQARRKQQQQSQQ